MPKQFIHLDMLKHDGSNLCRTEIEGDLPVLIQMVYSTMMEDKKFAEIILIASHEFLEKNTPMEAVLN